MVVSRLTKSETKKQKTEPIRVERDINKILFISFSYYVVSGSKNLTNSVKDTQDEEFHPVKSDGVAQRSMVVASWGSSSPRPSGAPRHCRGKPDGQGRRGKPLKKIYFNTGSGKPNPARRYLNDFYF